jgi:hypothetical protein
VYLGADEIPSEPDFPYLVAWAAVGQPLPADERLRGYSGAILTRHQVTIAALTSLDCVGAAARARNLLHRWQPTVAGRRCGDIAMDPGGASVPVVDPTVTGPHGQRIYVTYLFFTFASDLESLPNQ